jgi:hypothetical protein
MSDEKPILPLLHQLYAAGLWLQCKPDGTVIIGSAPLVAKHRDLVEQVRPYKDAISQFIAGLLVYQVLGDQGDAPRLAEETCPVCGQRVYVMAPTDGVNTSTRRLSVHRQPDRKTVCPGGGRAATVEVAALLQAFIQDRCMERPGALLTWTSLWNAFKAWCEERRLLPLPAPEALQEAMNQRFHPVNKSQGTAWGGLALQLREWWGDQPTMPPPAVQAPKQPPNTGGEHPQQQVLFPAANASTQQG